MRRANDDCQKPDLYCLCRSLCLGLRENAMSAQTKVYISLIEEARHALKLLYAVGTVREPDEDFIERLRFAVDALKTLPKVGIVRVRGVDGTDAISR